MSTRRRTSARTSSPKSRREIPRRLAGHVAVVAGATRGAGRGIARALGEAGATVYCTGRNVKGKPSPYRRPETIDETAAMIIAAGGTAIALRVDHTSEREVKALFRRILRAHKRIDIVVDGVAEEDPGFLRSESMLQHFGVTEGNWRRRQEGFELAAVGIA